MSSSQTPGPAAKRRRVEVANAALRKPFRSPLINRPKTDENDANNTDDTNDTTPSTRRVVSVPNSGGTSMRATSTPAFSTPVRSRPQYPSSPISGIAARNSARPLLYSRSSNNKRGGGINGSRKSTTTTPLSRSTLTAPASDLGAAHPHTAGSNTLLDQMRRIQRGTTACLREAETQLGVIQQAARIERESRAKRPDEGVDAELKELIVRWRGASRQAAEDVFERIRDRVESMGGARVWRESMRRQREFYAGMGGEEERDRKKKRREEGSEERNGYIEDDGCGGDETGERREADSKAGEGEKGGGDEESVC